MANSQALEKKKERKDVDNERNLLWIWQNSFFLQSKNSQDGPERAATTSRHGLNLENRLAWFMISTVKRWFGELEASSCGLCGCQVPLLGAPTFHQTGKVQLSAPPQVAHVAEWPPPALILNEPSVVQHRRSYLTVWRRLFMGMHACPKLPSWGLIRHRRDRKAAAALQLGFHKHTTIHGNQTRCCSETEAIVASVASCHLLECHLKQPDVPLEQEKHFPVNLLRTI